MKITSLIIKSKISNQWRTGLCDWLNRCVRDWSKKKIGTVFLAFSLFSIGISTYVMTKSLAGRTDAVFLKRSQVPMPALPAPYPDYHRQRFLLLFKKIEQIKNCLDSLSIHDEARYQAILKANPGLLENIHSIETLVSQPNKK